MRLYQSLSIYWGVVPISAIIAIERLTLHIYVRNARKRYVQRKCPALDSTEFLVDIHMGCGSSSFLRHVPSVQVFKSWSGQLLWPKQSRGKSPDTQPDKAGGQVDSPPGRASTAWTWGLQLTWTGHDKSNALSMNHQYPSIFSNHNHCINMS